MTTQKWEFEPGHTAAEFSVRHMMVSNVRGHFKNITGSIEVDLDDPSKLVVEATIEATGVWTGDANRDGHLRAADFFDAENYPLITFRGDKVSYIGQNDIELRGDLTMRGVTKEVCLSVVDLGRWATPFWQGDEDKGPITRAGFSATAKVNRNDFGISWNGAMDRGGIVVGNVADITIDVEALLLVPAEAVNA